MGGQAGGVGMTAEEVQALFLYGDIIDLPAPEPRRHPRQPRSARAAQFAPFAALTGYGDQVREAARGTQERRELSVDEQERIAAALAELAHRLQAAGRAGVLAEIELFVPDAQKEGGSYMRRAVVVEKVDEAARRLVARLAPSASEREGGPGPVREESACGGGSASSKGGPAAQRDAGDVDMAPAAGGGRLLVPIDGISDLVLPGGLA